MGAYFYGKGREEKVSEGWAKWEGGEDFLLGLGMDAPARSESHLPLVNDVLRQT